MRASLKDEQGVRALVASLEKRQVSSEIISSLIKQNSCNSSDVKGEASKRLKESPLFIVTGQQVGLYGGPLLTFYKAVTAIKAARVMSERLKKNVLPIFWLQSEDHDLAEIAKVTISSSSGELRTILLDQKSAKNNRKPVGDVLLSEEVVIANENLREWLSQFPESEFIIKSIISSYAPGKSWSEAFLQLFKELFKNTPLLFFDLNRDSLKTHPSVKTIFKRSIEEMERIEASLVKCTEEFGVVQGVSLKSNSPLAFVSDAEGNRFRLTLNANRLFVAGGQSSFQISREDLLSLIDSNPNRFSTSALLRPLVQDSLFPTLAYVGGDAELQYHRQLDRLYLDFGLSAPILLSREKFRIMSKKMKQLVDDIGLPLDTFLQSNEKVGQQLRQSGKQFGIDTESNLQRIKIEIEKLSAELEPIVKEIDGTLEEPLRKTSANAINGYTQFLSRLGKASIQKDSVTLNRIEKIRSQIFPFGKEQERELGLISVLARTGEKFIEQLESLSPQFDGTIRELVIEEY